MHGQDRRVMAAAAYRTTQIAEVGYPIHEARLNQLDQIVRTLLGRDEQLPERHASHRSVAGHGRPQQPQHTGTKNVVEFLMFGAPWSCQPDEIRATPLTEAW